MKRQARKKSLTRRLSTTKDSQKLERETRKLVSKANARLDSLQRRYKSGTWASKKLANRLSSNKLNMWTKKGKIKKIGKNLTKAQLIGLNKAINQFLNSQTSTKKGISTWKKNQVESIKLNRSDDPDFTEEDAEDFFTMFGDNDFDFFASKIGASTLQEIIYDAMRG